MRNIDTDEDVSSTLLGLRAVRAGMRSRSLLLKRRLSAELLQDRSRALGIALIALVTAATIFGVTFGAARYATLHDLGHDVISVLASAGLLALSGALVLSSVGAAAQHYFSAKDLWFWDSTPVPPWARFTDRFLETLQTAAPTTMALGATALVGGALGAELGVTGALRGVVAVVLIACIPVSLGVIVAHAFGSILPAGALRRITVVILGVVVCVALVWFRNAKVEQYLKHDGPERILAAAKNVKELGPATLPSSLGARFVVDNDLVAFAGLCAWVALFVVVALLAHRLLSRRARDLAVDESPIGIVRGSTRDRLLKAAVRPAKKSLRPLVEKDILAFFRDPAQWGQGVLLLGVGIIYMVNTSILQSSLSSLGPNIAAAFLPAVHTGFVTFIAAGLAVRFAFPQVGLEGPAIWIVDGSPLTGKDVLYAKVIASLPVVVIYPTLVGAFGGLFVGLKWSLWILTTLMCFAVSLGVAAFGVGRGAYKPMFDAASLSELAIGPGAISTMMVAVALAFAGSLGALFAGAAVVGGGEAHMPLLVIVAAALVSALTPCLLALYIGFSAVEKGAVAFVRRREEEAVREFIRADVGPLVADE